MTDVPNRSYVCRCTIVQALTCCFWCKVQRCHFHLLRLSKYTYCVGLITKTKPSKSRESVNSMGCKRNLFFPKSAGATATVFSTVLMAIVKGPVMLLHFANCIMWTCWFKRYRLLTLRSMCYLESFGSVTICLNVFFTQKISPKLKFYTLTRRNETLLYSYVNAHEKTRNQILPSICHTDAGTHAALRSVVGG